MKVLIGCEYSATVRDAFRKRGHDAWSCDLLPSLGDPQYHLQADLMTVLHEEWDLLIAHPPCTYLANSGIRHLFLPGRWEMMIEATIFFRRILDCGIRRIAVENPVPHRYARERIGQYDQIIQPWQFGTPEQKRTCLWLRDVPPLRPTRIVDPGPTGNKTWTMRAPKRNRGLYRSRTFAGIADAMADQWGDGAQNGPSDCANRPLLSHTHP